MLMMIGVDDLPQSASSALSPSANALAVIAVGHTFIATDSGNEVVDDFRLEIAVARC